MKFGRIQRHHFQRCLIGTLFTLIFAVPAVRSEAGPVTVGISIDWTSGPLAPSTSTGTAGYDDSFAPGVVSPGVGGLTLSIDVNGTIFDETMDFGFPFSPTLDVTAGGVGAGGLTYVGVEPVSGDFLSIGGGNPGSATYIPGDGVTPPSMGTVTFGPAVPIPEPASFALWALASSVLVGGKLCRRRKAGSTG